MTAAKTAVLAFLCIFIFVVAVHAQTDVLTQHGNNFRTGWNNKEVILNKTNVSANTFGKLFARTVDDQMYAQPLVKLNLAIPGKGTKNVVFAATVNNTVYAYDADADTAKTPYWQVNLTKAGCRVPNHTDMTGACGGYYNDFSGNIGIVGTPVIDSATNTMYLVARSLNASTGVYYQYLHALDITTGAERASSPMLITATVFGDGDGSSGGLITLDPQHANQRGGLLLLNGIVYIAWSSHCDWPPYHGFVIGYDKTSLQQKYVYCSTPDGYNGGIWMSGAGPSADENGNIYVGVGNGSVGLNSTPADLTNRSESALKLGPSLQIQSFFTPNNFETLEGSDLDFGVTQFMLIPNTNRGVVGVKDGHIYLINRDTMGGFNQSANQNVQTIDLGSNAFLRSAMSYYKGAQNEYVYSWSENSLLRAFPYSRTTNMFDLNSTISSGIQGPTGNNGAVLSVSSNGSNDSTAILWASYAATGDANQSVRPGILRAIDATNPTQELWNSSTNVNDDPGSYAKFSCPTVANGKVYLGTFSGQLMVYGLTKDSVSSDGCSTTNLALNQTAIVSSIESGSYTGQLAIDGNFTTRWSSQFSDPQYLIVDLGKAYNLCKVALYWETALASEFKIQTSNDMNTWVDAAHITNNLSYTNVIYLSANARYVRMYGIQRGTQYGYSLYEMQVFGTAPVVCKAPDSLNTSDVYGTSAVLHWSATGTGKYLVDYKTVTATTWQQIIVDTNSLALTNLACNTPYQYQVQSICGAGDSSVFSTPGAFTSLPCDVACSPLPTRWSTEDVGNPETPGLACYNSATGTFELLGYGTDIGGTADQFRFAFKTLVGNGDLITRIVDLDNTEANNKFGVMVRESLAPGARNAFLALTSGEGAIFQTRSTTDTATVSAGFPNSLKPPYWLKLNINGSVYTPYTSPDGLTWTPLGSAVNAGFGNEPVYAGLAITSHNATESSTGHADNYGLSGLLPLKLISFTGHLSLKNSVALQWITTLESNIKYFIVERTSDNNYYKDIDTVAADNDGDFTEVYNVQDYNPGRGMNYYRLKIIDKDGGISYSPIVAIKFNYTKPPVMYPNPANGFVNFAQGTDPIKQINIYTVMGRPVISVPNNGQQASIHLPLYNVSSGMYFIEIRTTEGVYRDKLVIHN